MAARFRGNPHLAEDGYRYTIAVIRSPSSRPPPPRIAAVARSKKPDSVHSIEAYRGTQSLPFAPGPHRRIAVKIVDDRGIESLRVMELE